MEVLKGNGTTTTAPINRPLFASKVAYTFLCPLIYHKSPLTSFLLSTTALQTKKFSTVINLESESLVKLFKNIFSCQRGDFDSDFYF